MLQQQITITFCKVMPRPTLTVTRKDGTSTWMKLYPGMALHDLAHYVVETILELNDAFYGMLAQGYDIQDFEAPIIERHPDLIPANLPVIAIQVEHLVNLLLTELQTEHPLPNFMELLNSIMVEADLPLMEVLTERKLERIREHIINLRDAWKVLPQEGVLTFLIE